MATVEGVSMLEVIPNEEDVGRANRLNHWMALLPPLSGHRVHEDWLADSELSIEAYIAQQVESEVQWAKAELTTARQVLTARKVLRELYKLSTSLAKASGALNMIGTVLTPGRSKETGWTEQKAKWIKHSPCIVKAAMELRFQHDDVTRVIDWHADHPAPSEVPISGNHLDCADNLMGLLVAGTDPYFMGLESKHKAASESLARAMGIVDSARAPGAAELRAQHVHRPEAAGAEEKQKLSGAQRTIALELIARIVGILESSGIETWPPAQLLMDAGAAAGLRVEDGKGISENSAIKIV